MHRVIGTALNHCGRRTPGRIFPAGHMPAAELRRAPVALLHDLHFLWDARVEPPGGALARFGACPVNVARTEKALPAFRIHDDGEVLVWKHLLTVPPLQNV